MSKDDVNDDRNYCSEGNICARAWAGGFREGLSRPAAFELLLGDEVAQRSVCRGLEILHRFKERDFGFRKQIRWEVW